MAGKSRSVGGRPSFKPTDEQRRLVKMMVSGGIPHPDISRCLGISEPTLRKHFRNELDIGMAEAQTQAVARLRQIMMQQEDIKAATTATIFYLKTKGGFSERQQVEHSGEIETKGGVPAVTVIIEGGAAALAADSEILEDGGDDSDG
jgi:DNA-binding CsgD family transcriptional regulator